MVKVTSGNVVFYLDGYLKANLDFVKKDVRDDSDAIIIVDGVERSGKSVWALQAAKYVDPQFDFGRLCFTAAEFREAVIKVPKYSAIVWDEALSGVRAVNWSQEANKGIIQLLSEIGQKNLVIFIVAPSFFEFNKYIALHRSLGLINVYRNKDGRRGFFAFYDWNKKKNLYLYGRAGYNYSVTSPNFIGRFTNFYALDEAHYRQRKFQALSAKPVANGGQRSEDLREMRDRLIRYVVLKKRISQSEVCGVLSGLITKSMISRITTKCVELRS